jgi:TolB-like protein
MKNASALVLSASAIFVLCSGCMAGRGRQVQNMKSNLTRQIQKGEAYMQRGAPRKAYQHYTTCLRTYMRYAELKNETAQLFVHRGKVALAMNHPDKAEKDFGEARRYNPRINIVVQGKSADVHVPPSSGTTAPPPPPPNPNTQPYSQPQPRPHTQPQPPANAGQPRHQPKKRILIAILDFKEPPATAGKGYGTSFANMLTNELDKGGVFSVVERSILDKIMAEKNLSQTDLIKKAKGSSDEKKILSVRFLLYGNIMVEGNAVSVTGRLIDWETGLSAVSDMSKRIIGHNASPSFYFDEIARDLGRKLEQGYLGSSK